MRVACDGYVGPQGQAAWAFVCDDGTRRAGPLPRGSASHLAEWRAVEEALAHLDSHAPGDVVLQVDSALVAKGLGAKRYHVEGEPGRVMAACRAAMAALARKGVVVRVERVPREANAEADALSRGEAHRAPG